MNLNDLTPEQKKALKEQFEAEEKAARDNVKREKETYKQLQNDFVDMFFPKLADTAGQLTLLKTELFENAKAILDMKCAAYGISAEQFGKQQSHTISNGDFSRSIILGRNVVDGWDTEVANAGVGKVNDWLSKQATSSNATLIGMIRDLLKPNKDGLLKAPRVLELMNQAEKIGDSELIEAVSLLREAYRPKSTTTYVKAKMKDEDGGDVWLNLSMSQA